LQAALMVHGVGEAPWPPTGVPERDRWGGSAGHPAQKGPAQARSQVLSDSGFMSPLLTGLEQ
jgi:hypothetical protein